MTDTTPLTPELTSAWSEAMHRRISSRRYDGSPIDPELLDRLDRLCGSLASPLGQARAVVIPQAPPEVFTGLIGSYGRVDNAPSLVAFIGGSEDGLAVGYIGEAVVLEATAAGLDSCWIAGAFDASEVGPIVGLADGERVHSIAALGRAARTIRTGERLMRAAVRARHRLPLETIAPGHLQWPTWARSAVEAARIAPSGGNKQPWRFAFDADSLVLNRTDKAYWTVNLDLGIAMLHAEIGAAHAGASGAWLRGEGSQVARFAPAR